MCYLRIDFFFADIHFQFAWEWFLNRWFFFCMQLGFIYSLSSIVVSKRSHNHKNIRANVKWFLLEAVKRQLRYFLHLFSSIPNFFYVHMQFLNGWFRMKNRWFRMENMYVYEINCEYCFHWMPYGLNCLSEKFNNIFFLESIT